MNIEYEIITEDELDGFVVPENDKCDVVEAEIDKGLPTFIKDLDEENEDD